MARFGQGAALPVGTVFTPWVFQKVIHDGVKKAISATAHLGEYASILGINLGGWLSALILSSSPEQAGGTVQVLLGHVLDLTVIHEDYITEVLRPHAKEP